MCKVSNKIKFCTCKSKTPDKLKNYWVIHRYDQNYENYIIGEAMLPNFFNHGMILYNEELLLNRINEPDAFDIELSPKPMDLLEIRLSCTEHFPEGYPYGFEFNQNKWVPCEYDSFSWAWKHFEAEFGKVKSIYPKLAIVSE